MFFYIYSKKKNYLRDTSDSSVIIYIPEDIFIKIIKIIKFKVFILTAKKYDCFHQYKSNEFYTFINEKIENESLIYDSKYLNNLNNKEFKNQEEKDNYKKKFTEQILKSIETKNQLYKIMIDNFSDELILKNEEEIINSFNYNKDNYNKSLKHYIKTNE